MTDILTINTHYKHLMFETCKRGAKEVNSRTGVEVRIFQPGAYSFKVELGTLPVPGNRRYFPGIAAAEVAWQFLGTEDPQFIMKYAPKVWGKFINDAGLLSPSYGQRWRATFGRDQIAMALDALGNDKTNRQVYISAWDPSSDGLGAPNQPPNIPCPVGFSLNVVGDKLHCSVFMRSSDIAVGLPYDVMGYALTVDALAASLDLAPGTLHFTLAHAHYYEPQAKLVEQSIYGTHKWLQGHEPQLPGWSIDEILLKPHAYVDIVKRLARRKPQHTWDPKPDVVE